MREAAKSDEFRLSDTAWSAIEALLPKRQLEAQRLDDRFVISGNVPVLQSDRRWEECLAIYGRRTRFTIGLTDGVAAHYGREYLPLWSSISGVSRAGGTFTIHAKL